MWNLFFKYTTLECKGSGLIFFDNYLLSTWSLFKSWIPKLHYRHRPQQRSELKNLTKKVFCGKQNLTIRTVSWIVCAGPFFSISPLERSRDHPSTPVSIQIVELSHFISCPFPCCIPQVMTVNKAPPCGPQIIAKVIVTTLFFLFSTMTSICNIFTLHRLIAKNKNKFALNVDHDTWLL